MKKKHLFIKSICSFALAATLLFSNELTAFARHANETTTTIYPFVENHQIESGWISLELVANTNADKSEFYFTPESTIKFNCIDADHLPNTVANTSIGIGIGTTAVVIFYPDSTMEQRGIKRENLVAFDIYDETGNIIKDVYVRETPYSFGDACKIVTPELIASVNQYGSGKLFIGISGCGAGFEIASGDYIAFYPIIPNDFILDDYQPVSTETASPAVLPSESQDVQPESVSAAPAEVPVQASSTDIVYTVAKYDTLGVIALNYYGSYEASKQLYKVNKDNLKQNNNKLNDGMQLKLPAVLGNYTLIAPPQITGDEKLYSVKSGDTLRTIAQNIYGDSSLYQNLFERNKDRIKDVNHIYEGLIIICP